ncbi:MAG: response regulator [Pseudomonadota bacterium]
MENLVAPTVLIVEDEPLVRLIVATGFEDAGFTVLEAGHAAEALAIHEGGASIQFLFTDVNMPGDLNGIDLAERIRASAPEVHIFIASALPVLRAIDHIGATFFAKPYRVEEVCSAALALHSI